MKITKSKLKIIINEEISRLTNEGSGRRGTSPFAIFPEIYIVLKQDDTPLTLKEIFSKTFRLKNEATEIIKKKIIKDNDYILKNAAEKINAVEQLEPSLKLDHELEKITLNIKNPRENKYLHLSDYQTDNKLKLLKQLLKTENLVLRRLDYFNDEMQNVLGVLNIYFGDSVQDALKNALESFETASRK